MSRKKGNIVRRYKSVSVLQKKGIKWICNWLIPIEQRTTKNANNPETQKQSQIKFPRTRDQGEPHQQNGKSKTT